MDNFSIEAFRNLHFFFSKLWRQMTRNRLNVIFLRTTHAVFAWASIMVVRSYPEPALLVRTIYIIWFHKTEEKNMFSLVCFVCLRRVSFLSCCWLLFRLITWYIVFSQFLYTIHFIVLLVTCNRSGNVYVQVWRLSHFLLLFSLRIY